MISEKHKIGHETLNRLSEGTSEKVIKNYEKIAPDVSDYIMDFVFGEIYNRPKLDFKTRQVVTLTALLTQGDTDHQLQTHIKGAISFGWSEDELIEMFIQAIPYVGFPRVLNAINSAKRVFNQK